MFVLSSLETPHHSSSSMSHVTSSDVAGPSSSSSGSASAMSSGGLQVPANSEPTVRRQQGANAAAPSGKVPKWFKVGEYV